jgi:2-keto-3-deoxy-L-rhamnonate aldolase RhmA
MRPNPLKALWAEGKPAFGTWCTLVNHPRFMKLLATCGLDFVILEMEHTDFTIRDVSTLALMAREAGIAPVVRPPGLLSPHDLTRALDAGAQGLLLPNVTGPEVLERVIAATKYHPRGERILNLRGPHTDYQRLPDPAEQIARINAGTVTVAMIETRRGLDALPEICAVDGLDAVMIGPDDLSQDLGVPGLLNDPKMLEATERVIAVCTGRGMPWGFSCQDLAAAERWLARGISWMPFANDAAVLFNAFSGAAAGLKKLSNRA